MTLLLLIAAIGLQSAAPVAGQWRVVASDQDATTELDLSSLARNGDRIVARLRAVLNEPYNGIHFVVGEVEQDCRTRTTRTLATSNHDRDGRLINRTTPDDPPLRVDGSNDEPIHEAICREARALTRVQRGNPSAR